MARVVVVGGGLGGLATAIRLADFGHDVVLCEQHGAVGGRLRGTGRGDARIDLAPGPLTLPAVLRDLFGKTGRPLDKVLDLIPAEPAFGYRFAGGLSLELPNTGRAGVGRALDEAFGAGSGAAWQEMIDYGGAIWSVVRSPYLIAAPTRAQRLVVGASPRRRRRLGLDRTLRSVAESTLAPPLGAMLEHRAAGVDPRRAPAGLAAIAYVHQTFGRWYVRGGPSRLAAALHDRAVERGVTVRTGTQVRAVERSGRRVSGVRVQGGERLGADVVVAAVDAERLDLDPPPDPTPARRVRPSPGRFTLTLALDSRDDRLRQHGASGSPTPPADPPSHTVVLSSDPDAELDAVHSPSARPSAAPTLDVYTTPDRSRLTASAVVPGHGTDIDWTAPGIADDFADRIVAMLAEHGWDVQGLVRWRHVHTPADAMEDVGAVGGGDFGPAITTARDLAARSNRAPVRGLFRAGSAAYPGPGIPLTGISAAIVADLIGRA